MGVTYNAFSFPLNVTPLFSLNAFDLKVLGCRWTCILKAVSPVVYERSASAA